MKQFSVSVLSMFLSARKAIKVKAIFAVLLLSFVSHPSPAQTKDDFEKSYGSQKYYEIRSGIVMFARFDKSGQICEADLQPIRFPIYDRENAAGYLVQSSYKGRKKTTVFYGERVLIYPAELKDIIEELAPVAMRGKLLSPTPLIYEREMRVKYRRFEYENLSIQTSKTIFIDNDYREDKIDVENGYFGSAHFAKIKWLKRVCLYD